MSPVTVVDISGLVLGDLTFLHPHLQVDPLPATNSSWARDPRSFWTGFRAISGPIFKEHVDFRACALVKRVCAGTAFRALQEIRITSCLLGPELRGLRLSWWYLPSLHIAGLRHCRAINPSDTPGETPHLDPSSNWGAPFASQGKRDGVSPPQTPCGSGPTPCNH